MISTKEGEILANILVDSIPFVIQGQDMKHSKGIYANYVLGFKMLKNELLNETVESLGVKLKSLGLEDEEIKKLKTKLERVEKVIELL